MRLPRLNIYGKFFLRKFHHEQVHGQYGAYFSSFYGPLLFIFAVFSIFLIAMQVELSVESLTSRPWQPFWYLSRWFSVLILTCLAFSTLSLVLLLIGIIVHEWVSAIRYLRTKEKEKDLSKQQV